ncbi:putative F-box domain-containing protein [Helianthus annuus]|uniref:F-box domain-containing protein n=1 Tax=Helianthus annuus TaxID=4232 RepID=A0A251T2Z6_HELAN|nr:F-box protein SNE [Helianthus annuus]KAF5778372.1 putative F-box domain-containing protein [Helianthus annuus]KAJ0489784.1 putative F-box protein SNE [Helianthus annuus]KAJ0493777.1 putative F-box domain-containing protein [Helianthus annuus]KAJ0505699.1 putative F-box protein SNE [Helianthus annuus]KAJ0675368.1 putative F-box protein SNE [Helianthus annuus]
MVHILENGEHFHADTREPEPEPEGFGSGFSINDHHDLLIEVLKRLDGRSLGAAACVCRQWCAIARNDSLWEHLCFRHVSPPPVGVRPVVSALGGYRRLYMVCVRPVLSRLKRRRLGGESEVVRRVWNQHEVELSLSLFCVEYYERLLVGGGRVAGDSPASSSLKFLCMPVNV